MKTELKIISLIGMLLMCIGCSSDHESLPDSRSLPISFGTVTIENGEPTRVVGADEHNTGLPQGATIDVFIYNSSGTPVPSDDEPNSDPAVTLPLVYITTEIPNPETAQSALILNDASLHSPKYPSGGDAYIFAVWPAKATTTEASADSYTFTVQTDQRSAANVTASDLLATDQIVQPQVGGKAIDLPMTHCMAKVIVKFTASGSLSAANLPDEFTVQGVKNSVTIKPRTAATSSGRGAISTNSGTVTLQCNTSEPFLIPPQRVEADSEFMKFDIKGSTSATFAGITGATFKPASSITFEANTVYEITIAINADYITATATITPWNTEDMVFDKVIL